MNIRNDDRLPYRERPSRSSIRRPERNLTPARNHQSNKPDETAPSIQPSADPARLAQTRKEFGFDDIPVDEDNMEHVRFRDIMRAWARQTIKHSPLEEKFKNVTTKNSRLKSLKNDLKWALQADLDEPVKPTKKPIQPPVNVVSDKQPTQKPPLQPAEPLNKTIDININFGSLPKLPPLKKSSKLDAVINKIRKFKWTRKRIIVAAVIIVIFSGAAVAGKTYYEATGNKTASTKKVSSDSAKKPEYTTLLPGGKSIDSLGGWHRVSPPDRDPVFAFVDKVDGVQINVSQQPMPDDFKGDTTKNVAELAKSFNATEKIEADDITIYIGTSSKGPQSAIFAREETLILMKSQAKISNEAWAAYAESLK